MAIPTIEIDYSDNPKKEPSLSGDLTLRPYPKQNKIYVETYGIFDKTGFNSIYDLDPNNNIITELLTKDFEYQILLAEK